MPRTDGRGGACLAGSGRSHQYPTNAEPRKYALDRSRPLNILSRLFGHRQDRQPLVPLYEAIVAEGRNPAWYRDGAVPDTTDSRFDMIVSVLSLVLIRLEREGEAARADSVRLTELFIDDMDGQLRQLGIGDIVVGKHVGKMMGALGGRLGAFRDALAGVGDLREAVRRNIFRGEEAAEQPVAFVAGRLMRLHERLGGTALEPLRSGAFPSE
jgi:cytochrome b pre-mRNA-processing protein 3